jgi:hypothetical protein
MNNERPYLCCSLDGLSLVLNRGSGNLEVIMHEIKTKTTTELISKSRHRVNFTRCEATDARMKEWVPERGHRAQVLHLAATTSIGKLMYSKASTSEHLHSVLITFSKELIDDWRLVLETIHDGMDMSLSNVEEWGTAVDANTVAMFQKLRQAIVTVVEATGVPVPELKYIKPAMISGWNPLKVAVDVSTRMMKNAQVPNESLKPQLYFFDRYLKMLLLDVYLLVGCCRIWSELRDGKILTQPQYKARLHELQGAFRDFMGRVGLALARRINSESEVGVESGFKPGAFAHAERRDAFTNRPDHRQFRLSGQQHRRLDMDGPSTNYCELCAGTFKHELKGEQIQHAGGRPMFACLDCGGEGRPVRLCKQESFFVQDLVDADLLDAKDAASFKKPNNQNPKISCWTMWHLVQDLESLHAFAFEKLKMAKIAVWTEKQKQVRSSDP